MYWAHGRPDASAATPAPYVLLSTSSASGRTSAMAVVRSSASHGPRGEQVAGAVDVPLPAGGVVRDGAGDPGVHRRDGQAGRGGPELVDEREAGAHMLARALSQAWNRGWSGRGGPAEVAKALRSPAWAAR
jgi:hypothetical protein